jgi:acyl-CoA thioesterase-1
VIYFPRSIFKAGILLGACLLLSSCQPSGRLSPLESDAKILAFGDSLTYGTGVGRDQSYPMVLSELLSRTVISAGVPGEISADGLKRLSDLLQSSRPDLVVLCHGGNDILRRMKAAQTEKNLRLMIELVRRQGAEVVVVAVPAFGLFPKAASYYEAIEDDLNVPVEADILASLLSSASKKSDQVHLNAIGYREMAVAIEQLLRDEGAL